MHLEDALDQIRAIRGQLARAEIYRGARAASIAATALVAYGAALLQPVVVARPDLQPNIYILFWSAAAAIAGGIIGFQIIYSYLKNHNLQERATARAALGAIAPPIGAGAVVTAVLAARAEAHLLPGLWPIFVGLTFLASRQLLPRCSGLVGLCYLCAGSLILLFLRGPQALAPWVMGLTFTSLQLAAAAVFYWNLERESMGECGA